MNNAYNDRRRRGASLPTVMMVVTLMMMLAFTVVAIAFNHLNLTFRSSNNAKAELLAEAVLAQAIEKARVDPENYGIVGEQTIELELDAYPGGKGYLSFDKDEASVLGVPVSTNNRKDGSVPGPSPPGGVPFYIPGESMHLVARAEVNGAYSTMHAVVKFPKFPYSIASGGAIKSNGGLLVASLKPDVYSDLSLPIHEEDLEPGHLVSNSKSGDSAIEMTGENTIMGDLRSASGVTINADTRVFGEMRLNADPVELPVLHASSYDPRGSSPDGIPSGSPPGADEIQYVHSGAASLSVKGYNVSEGPLTVDNGITLNGGVLFVDGALTVSAGGIQGKGAVIATGDITVIGGGEATTDNQAALISDGNITLRGASPTDKAKFAGLVYTKGNLTSENFRLAGVFVAAGEHSDVTLRDTELYHVKEKAQLTFTPELEFPAPAVPYQALNGFEVQASYDLSGLEANLESYRNPNTGPGEPEYLFISNTAGGYKTYKFDAEGKAVVTTLSSPNPAYVLDGQKMGLRLFGQVVTSQAQAEAIIVEEYTKFKGEAPDSTQETTLRGFGRTLFVTPQSGLHLSRAAAEFTAINGRPDSPDGTAKPFLWSIDLSEFVNKTEYMQVVYWARFQ